MESERVILICNNHHTRLSYKYFNYFKYLINWKEIFDYDAEIIYTLIRISVDNFRKTKNFSLKQQGKIRKIIVKNLKKRYIIEKFYGEFCHVCGEFSIRDYLNAFHFSHLSRNTKNYEPSSLFHLYCSKIVNILEEEKGGYVCANCHNVLDFKNVHLADKIYEDNKITKKVLTDYNSAQNKFQLIRTKGLSIKNPLEKTTRNNKSFETYLYAIYNISNSGIEVTNDVLAQYLNIKNTNSLWNYFNRNDFIKELIDIHKGKQGHTLTKYTLNNKGVKVIYLLEHFKEYYNSL